MVELNKVIFLLAGTSSRFKGIVEHKALLKLQGQTLLERQIITAANYGIGQFVFAIGGAQEIVVNEIMRIFYQKTVPFASIAFIYCPHYKTTNNAQSLYECKNELKGWCLLFECDVAAVLPQKLPVQTSLWFTVENYKGDGSFVHVASDGFLSRQVILKGWNPADEAWQKSAGIFLLSPSVTDKLREVMGEPPSSTIYIDGILPLSSMKPYQLTEWWEIDTVEDFEIAKKIITSPVKLLPVDPVII